MERTNGENWWHLISNDDCRCNILSPFQKNKNIRELLRNPSSFFKYHFSAVVEFSGR